MKKAIIAMSGGVDSSVAAWLMKEQGYDCSGITLKLYENEDIGESWEKSCCSLRDVAFARSVAERLAMPFEILNYGDAFRSEVMDRFVSSYNRGETPNPCIDCNRYIKFDRLIAEAIARGVDYVVSGHYAQIRFDEESGRYRLSKAIDASKDQSYVLYALNQEQLAHLLLPLGGMHKTEVRALAEEHHFANAHKQDSQDICFVMDGDYARFIEDYAGITSEPGDFVDLDGKVLGRHRGIIHYTIGQRKGLGIAAPTPKFVLAIDVENNRIVLGEDDDLFGKTLTACDANWIAFEKLEAPMRAKAKIRYRHQEQDALVEPLEDGRFKATFDKAQRAITKGQAVVLYDGDEVIGGGQICGVG